MTDDNIVDIPQDVPSTKEHGRSSSSDQPLGKSSSNTILANSVERDDDHLQQTPSPSRTKSRMGDRPRSKRQRSTTSATSQKPSRPTYSRKYSTPPSRPLSPSGYPQLLESDGLIPEMNLNTTMSYKFNHVQEPYVDHTSMSNQYYDLSVDTAPQEPDIWEDPETDYFTTVEGPAKKHSRAKSRKQLSHAPNALRQEINSRNLQQISEDLEFSMPPTPGAFAV